MSIILVKCLIVVFLASETVFATTLKSEIDLKKKQGQQEAAKSNSETDEDPNTAAEASNCRIKVLSIRHSGIQEVTQFFSNTKNKADCEKRANPHRPNLYPDQVKQKIISIQFIESP